MVYQQEPNYETQLGGLVQHNPKLREMSGQMGEDVKEALLHVQRRGLEH
jgi:hypothetical protein